VLSLLVLIVGVIWGVVALGAKYSIWHQRMNGEAQLAKATYTKQIAVQEATAKKSAAVLLADAEILRAKGVAKANQIIGQSLNHNEAYLRYLWIDHLQNEHNQVIYVPTEANLPILEAHRFNAIKEK
jgi:hypothetical protein